jgi:hypothetical protein
MDDLASEGTIVPSSSGGCRPPDELQGISGKKNPTHSTPTKSDGTSNLPICRPEGVSFTKVSRGERIFTQPKIKLTAKDFDAAAAAV